ncbi:MAG: family 78 glycoside hydrolase catalytic domain [Ignavibacteria bacterium]
MKPYYSFNRNIIRFLLKGYRIIRFMVFVGVLLFGVVTNAADVTSLRCEYLINPLGIDVKSPRLSWNILSSKRGDMQTAYQIIVSSTRESLSKNNGDVWDSGKVDSDESIHVEYDGIPLKSLTRYFWKVKVWDIEGTLSKWSEPAFWSMGLLDKKDWKDAQWIAYKDEKQWEKEWKQHKENELKDSTYKKLSFDKWWPWFTGKDSTIFSLYENADPKYDPSPLFRKQFGVEKEIKNAGLSVCGLGYYEVFLNGEKIGDHVLDPAWTNFEQRAIYVTYDVTKQLKQDENAIGIMLGRGQFNPLCNDIWGLYKSAWSAQPKAIALLYIEYTDGTTKSIITDDSWKTTGGPIVYDDTRHGELYDARLEQKGWTSANFNDDNWRSVSVVENETQLKSQMMPPIKCFTPYIPVKEFNKGEGITVYDIGQNIAGWARVTIEGPIGAKVLVEYCETPSDKEILPDLPPSRFQYEKKDKHYASFYDKNINVRQQNGYILKGEGEETFECHFSYKGFQYIRITIDKGVKVKSVEGIPVHSAVEEGGDFSCSNPIINQIQKNAVNSLLSNFHSIETDCPHREKQGWTADNYMSAKAAMYNFDMASFYSKWLIDLAGTQSETGGLCTVAPSTNYDMGTSTAWPIAIVLLPLDIYEFYADRKTCEDHYDAMNAFAKSSLNRQVEGKPEIINDVLGDWIAPLMTLCDTARNNTMVPPEGLTLYGTASHFLTVKKIFEINKLLDRDKDAEKMNEWANRISENFNKEFFDSNSMIYHGDKPTPYRQSPNVVALEYGLVPKESQKAVLNNLLNDIKAKGNRLSTGFLGTWALMKYLPEIDPELSYILASHENYPGWGYMVKQGANSMWESWDGYDSHNHVPFCLISEYFYKYLAGIQTDSTQPGFKNVIINPSIVGDLRYVNAYHNSMYGRIESNWEQENGKLTMEVVIPANTTATVYIPSKTKDEIMESGVDINKVMGIEYLQYEKGKAVYKIGSGKYIFRSVIN